MTNITICLCLQLRLDDAPIGGVDSCQIIVNIEVWQLIISNQLLFEYNYLEVNLSLHKIGSMDCTIQTYMARGEKLEELFIKVCLIILKFTWKKRKFFFQSK